MQKIISPIAILLLIAGVSCNQSYLDVKPTSSITAGNFYHSQQDIQQAVVGVYSSLRDWPVDIYFYLSEVRSNNYYAVFEDGQRDYFDISNFQESAQDGTIHDTWESLYKMINRANEVLASIDRITITPASLKTQYKAETRFLRAYAYFQLVQLWGRVPLVDRVISPADGIKIKQSEPADIYKFITSEMSAVKDSLPPDYAAGDQGRATEWAVKGILAKVYLTMAGYPLQQADKLDSAKVLLQDIIGHEGSTPKLKLTPNYADLFGYKNNNLHDIFEVEYLSGGLGVGSSLPSECLPNLNKSLVNVTILNSANRLTISQDLLTSYESNDLRFNTTLDTSYLTNDNPPQHGNTPFFKKFVDFGLTTLTSYNDWPENFPLLRYADVLLMYAEVLNDQAGTPPQQAFDILNRVRARAKLKAITPLTKDDFALALEKERRHEFANEGQYWFDLVRTNRAIPVMNTWFAATSQNKTIDKHNLLYPIPQTEIDIYPGLYTQNSGY